jgi:ABC-type antimicrobial peptide transport system permease subunit
MAEVMRGLGLITQSVSKLFASCFAFALLLALVGTYGLMSRSIGLRRREIGVRRALGASNANVTALLLRQGAAQVGIGALVAVPLLLAIGIGFAKFFPVGVWLTLFAGAGVSLGIVVAVVATTWFPTRRVVRVAPRDALWVE